MEGASIFILSYPTLINHCSQVSICGRYARQAAISTLMPDNMMMTMMMMMMMMMMMPQEVFGVKWGSVDTGMHNDQTINQIAHLDC